MQEEHTRPKGRTSRLEKEPKTWPSIRSLAPGELEEQAQVQREEAMRDRPFRASLSRSSLRSLRRDESSADSRRKEKEEVGDSVP